MYAWLFIAFEIIHSMIIKWLKNMFTILYHTQFSFKQYMMCFPHSSEMVCILNVAESVRTRKGIYIYRITL